MSKFAVALMPLALVIFLLQAARPSAGVDRADGERIAAGAAIFADNCARCHASAAEWTEPGCRPASLGGVTQRYEKQQVMNLLNHGVMAMPSFASMQPADRDLLWDFLSALPADPAAGPTPGQYCGRVKAAMAGSPMAGACGGGARGCGGCGAASAKPAACSHAGPCVGEGPTRLRRGWSFGR